MTIVGVLALQGNFDAHRRAVESAGARSVAVRTALEMDGCDGLILPGGQSGTIISLLEAEGLLEPLRNFGRRRPIYGSCAGAVLLAQRAFHPVQNSLRLMDIDV